MRIEVTDSNKRKFEDRMKSKLRSLAKTKQSRARRKALHELKEDIRSWAEAFKLCDDVQKLRSYWLARAHWQFKEGPDFVFDEEETMSNTVYRTFKLHADQEEIVEAALNLAKEKSGTKFDTVALEFISQEFMGTGAFGYTDAASLFTALYKKAGNIDDLLDSIVNDLEKVTGLSITCSYEEGDETPDQAETACPAF